MRILAIRGRNLASLESFDIDFAADPLDSAGLFAITGPTGAGKSTLLDAMSLALYDTVPRLDHAAKVAVGDGRINQDDVRSILRHGASEAFAECDFVARDGRSYRARWEVARARTGMLKKREMSVYDLATGEGGGGNIKEIKARIADLIGLSAQQFGRAVMLSQGEFEAFIKAGSDERSELLEKLTGTEIYSKIGRLAGRKANALRGEHRLLQDRLAQMDGLSDEARAELDGEHAAAMALADARRAALALLERSRAWEAKGAELAQRVAEAEAALAASSTASADAEPRREALARQRKAAALVPSWRAMIAAETAAEEAETRTEEARAALDPAAAALAEATAAAEQAQAAAALAETTFNALTPELDRARTLDYQLREAALRIEKLEMKGADHTRNLPMLTRMRDQYGDALKYADSDLKLHADWFAENEPVRYVAQKEAELVHDLGLLTAFARKAEEAQADHDNQVDRGRHAVEDDLAARKARDDAATAMTGAKEALRAAAATLPTTEAMTAAQARRDGLAALAPLIGDAERASQTHQAQVDMLAAIAARRDATLGEIGSAQARHTELADCLPAMEAEARGAAATAERALAAQGDDAERLRATLVEGEPCPVCGSAAHALDMLEAALAAPARAAREHAEALAGQHATAVREHDAIAANLALLEARRDEQDEEWVSADKRLTALASALADAISVRDAAARDCGLEPGDALAAATTDARQEADALIAAHSAQRKAYDEAQSALNAARAAFDTARTAADLSGKARDDLAKSAEDAQRLTEQHRRDQRVLAEQLDKHLSALPGSDGDWTALADPTAWLGQLAREWRDRTAKRDNLVDTLPRLRAKFEEGKYSLGLVEEQAKQVAHELVAEKDIFAQLQAERAGVLGGAAVATVEDEHKVAIASAQSARDEALARQSSANSALLTVRIQALASAEEAERLRTQADAAADGLDAELATAGLTEEAVSEAAAKIDEFEAEDAALQALHDALTGATTALAERRADRDAHGATDAPGPLGAELAEAFEAARPALAEAEAQVQALYGRIAIDDRQRDKTADLRAEFEAWTERSRVWLALGDLIGDNDGKRFRKFAQSLTLDRLLEAANMRLAELKPRYILERASGGDMAIQVIDNDMAGEVRGLHNLSGGERFLVSLALALGLAEMSTGRGIRIESLFIDEGFGALDPASLGQALAVLEQLHATGRRVGVISHVEELKERIPVKIEVTPVSRGRSEVAVSVG